MIFKKIKVNIFIIIILYSSAIFSQDSLYQKYNKLKNLLNNEAISFDQFNKGIDNLQIESKDYQNLKDLFSSNVIAEEDYKQILENIITNLSPQISKLKTIEVEINKSNIQEIDLSFKIVFVGARVPREMNLIIGNTEKITVVIEKNKVKEIIIKDEQNNLFNKKFASFKDLRINLKDNIILKGKNKLLLDLSFAVGANLTMWWKNLDVSREKFSGMIDITIPDKGIQVKLEAI
jgi:hypothetical protein